MNVRYGLAIFHERILCITFVLHKYNFVYYITCPKQGNLLVENLL